MKIITLSSELKLRNQSGKELVIPPGRQIGIVSSAAQTIRSKSNGKTNQFLSSQGSGVVSTLFYQGGEISFSAIDDTLDGVDVKATLEIRGSLEIPEGANKQEMIDKITSTLDSILKENGFKSPVVEADETDAAIDEALGAS